MSQTELLLKEIEGLPDNYMGEIIDFASFLKYKLSPSTERAIAEQPGSSGRVGFLKGIIEVPVDFDTMGQETITALFEG
jgi:hypothetical protein